MGAAAFVVPWLQTGAKPGVVYLLGHNLDLTWEVAIPATSIAVVFACGAAVALRKRCREGSGVCACGYDLRANARDAACPECGSVM